MEPKRSGPVLQVRHLHKEYGAFIAVDDLSFEVHAGEIFGLLGPNGAGKTTTIRMIMDIFKADRGEVSILGQAPKDARARVGYLPEERGLYRDLKVIEALVYLAQLKGTSKAEATQRVHFWLERVELQAWANKKVKDLSRGMQQKVQFVASLIHDPAILILDEPFQGLDPVNVEMIKTLIRDQQAAGKTIILSAHEMNLVEALCDRILLINRGRAVLYGNLAEIKAQYAPRTVRVRTVAEIAALPGVDHIERQDGTLLLHLADTTPQAVLAELVRRQIPVLGFEVASVPLTEIFIAVVKQTPQMGLPNDGLAAPAKEGVQ